MFKRYRLVGVSIGVFLCSVAWAASPPGSWQYPAVKDAGAIHPLPNAAFQPDKTTIYKAVFSVTRNPKDAKDPEGGLEPVARAVNVFASAGVPLDHLQFVAVIHGEATPIVLDNAQYKKRFGVDNFNLKIIHELTTAGVKVVVCGQAIAGFGYQNGWVDPDVKVALSALSTIIILQHEGYVLMPL